MTDDVEQVVRRALRADSELITRESLQYTGVRTPQRPRRGLVLGTASVAAAAIIGGTVVAAQNLSGQTARRGTTDAAGESMTGDPFDGTRWKLTAIEHDGQKTSVPPSWDATVEFSGGRVSMYDTGNAVGGPYSRTPDGFTLFDQAITDKLVVSTDPVRTLVMQAMDAISFGGSSQANAGVVEATVDGDSMVLTIQGFTLTFSRDGQAHLYASPAPTGASPTAPTSDPATVDPFAGSKWKLRSINHDGQDTHVQASLDATIEFSDGRVLMDDTVNAIGGPYTRTPTGFTLSDLAMTAVGLVGAGPDQALVIQAIHAIGGVVTATVGGDAMVLKVPAFTLTFSRDGQVQSYSPQAPTESGSATTSATTHPALAVSAPAICAAALRQPIAASSLTTVGEIRGWERGGPAPAHT
jgi:hypothetical protein